MGLEAIPPMKILATSDLHGVLPKIEPCDLLLIGGDICPDYLSTRFSSESRTIKGEPQQKDWLERKFAPWLELVPAKHIVGIAGNHDFVFDSPIGIPDMAWTYLQDEAVEVEGIKIYGTPWVPNLKFWAFYGEDGHKHFDKIPEDTDILLSHGPMYGYGDSVPGYDGVDHVGDIKLYDAAVRVQPRAFICGHIHEGYGHYRHNHVELGVFNVAHNNEFYDPINPVMEISWDY